MANKREYRLLSPDEEDTLNGHVDRKIAWLRGKTQFRLTEEDFKDLRQECMIEGWKALPKYNEDTDVSLATYLGKVFHRILVKRVPHLKVLLKVDKDEAADVAYRGKIRMSELNDEVDASPSPLPTQLIDSTRIALAIRARLEELATSEELAIGLYAMHAQLTTTETQQAFGAEMKVCKQLKIDAAALCASDPILKALYAGEIPAEAPECVDVAAVEAMLDQYVAQYPVVVEAVPAAQLWVRPLTRDFVTPLSREPAPLPAPGGDELGATLLRSDRNEYGWTSRAVHGSPRSMAWSLHCPALFSRGAHPVRPHLSPPVDVSPRKTGNLLTPAFRAYIGPYSCGDSPRRGVVEGFKITAMPCRDGRPVSRASPAHRFRASSTCAATG
jgi:DNA-directed RNA polymerase specialized sigma24 family protein